MPSCLIVKTSAIGDVIQTLPVLEYLHARHFHIDWAVEQAGHSLLAAHPYLRKALVLDTKRWRKNPFQKEVYTFIGELRSTHYDILFDLQGNLKSALVTAFARASVKVGFDRKGVREKVNLLSTNHKIPLPPHLPIRTRYLQLVQRYFCDETPFLPQGVPLTLETPLPPQRPCIMVCFGSRWENKRLDPATLLSLLKQIHAVYNPYYLFVFGNSQEEQEAKHLFQAFPSSSQTLGSLSLPLWQGWMRAVDLILAVDSAALHLAATTDTPTLSFFGPSSSALYKPEGERHHALQGPCPYGQSFDLRCPKLRTCSTGACLKTLSASDLFAQSRPFLDNRLMHKP